MIEVILTVGVPGSRKSTWAKEFVAKDPANWMRINNDDFRKMANGCINNKKHDEVIRQTRLAMITAAATKKLNLVIDNLNLNKTAWSDTVEAVRLANVDAKVYEKIFFVPLEQALEDNAKRIGPARLDDKIIKQWWKISGGEKLEKRTPKEEILIVNKGLATKPFVQDESLPACAIFDLDGTMAIISHRSPYDASKCDADIPNTHVVNFAKLLHNNNYKIFFFSGREDKHKTMTEEWLNKHFGKSYSLHMRESENFEKDVHLKDRLFKTHVLNKFNCKAWVDDRLQIVKYVHEMGLPLFRVGDPQATF